MAAVTAEMVRDLRDKTGAGMMDCKKALAEVNGDMNAAIDALRKAGIAKAEKKSGRATKEGKIVSFIEGKAGSVVEILCETDFVAKNENFLGFVKSVAEKTVKLSEDGDVSAKIQEVEKEALVGMIAKIGENMQIRRAARWQSNGVVASYIHGGGRIGVLIDVEGTEDKALLSDICMHIAAFNPRYVEPQEVPADVIAKEKEIASAQVVGKPAQIVEKIVMGKISKWYSEVCLTHQPWIKDDKTSLSKLYPKVKVNRFIRWEVGEELQ